MKVKHLKAMADKNITTTRITTEMYKRGPHRRLRAATHCDPKLAGMMTTITMMMLMMLPIFGVGSEDEAQGAMQRNRGLS
mmetsp:Transcript_27498/g.91257  ORF Transcript_27498/g.91257 Transcript_27498/m.91257 type:complete len:80 (-) Transcript_27498:13-252(-)